MARTAQKNYRWFRAKRFHKQEEVFAAYPMVGWHANLSEICFFCFCSFAQCVCLCRWVFARDGKLEIKLGLNSKPTIFFVFRPQNAASAQVQPRRRESLLKRSWKEPKISRKNRQNKNSLRSLLEHNHVTSDGNSLCCHNQKFYSSIDFRFLLTKLIDLASQTPSCMDNAVARIVLLLFDGPDAYSYTGKFLRRSKTVSNRM